MASNQAIMNFLNAPPANAAKATRGLSPVANQRAQARYNPSPQLKAQIGAQLDAQAKAEKDAQQALKNQQAQQSLNIRQQNTNLRRQTEGRLEANTAAKAVSNLVERADIVGSRLENWASNIATPGGIGVLLFAIFLILWAVIPVNGGHTRAQLFWLTITGRTRMSDTPDAGGTYTDPAASPSSGATGASGNFGSGGVSPKSNGHSASDPLGMLAALNIRDFGSGAV